MTKIQLRRDSTVDWEAEDPVLDDGEPGVDLTTGELKIGDGSSAWTALDSLGAGGGGGGAVGIADLPAGSTIDVFQAAGGTWAARPTARTDIRVNWVGYPDLTSLPSGALADRDSYVRRTT